MAAAVTFVIKILDDSVQTLGTTFSASYSKKVSQRTTEATGVTDTLLAMGDVTTINGIYFESDQTVSLRFSSNTGTQWTVTANSPFLMTGISITAVYLSNSSGNTANISYHAWMT